MERLKNEFRGWRTWEVVWLAANCLVILALSLYWGDSVMGIISAVAGVAYVVCSGKGKLMAYFFGVINVVLYAIISYEAKFYGEVMLNALYYLPMQFYGFYVWSKNMDSETHEVKKRRMTAKGRAVLALAIAVSTVAYGFLLKFMGGTLPFVDSLSTVISVFTMVISVKMYMEQWMLWFVVNVVSTVMWAISFSRGGDSIATLVMWALYIANSVVMHVKWAKESKGAA
ncbi:MAG: nicotinamide mononucleotide transporter [Clostridia bacterium]|nr:nicotinamide mononucleotide transporter [Clostridia bacterium]